MTCTRGPRRCAPAAARATRRAFAVVIGLGVAAAVGCRKRDTSAAPDGPATDVQTQRYIKKAIRSSSEGVILLPSKRADKVFDLPRLNEIAQSLRQPAAECFVRRAIQTMEREGAEGRQASGRGYKGIPEGQAKFRARISPNGSVVRTEVLETGFLDTSMEPCIEKAIRKRKWPANRSGNTHFVDVVYWVSLGSQADQVTPQFRDRLKRESIRAGVRAKNCLRGRVDKGEYDVEGLNLLDREGRTIANRVEASELDETIRTCIGVSMRDIRLARAPEAFVRPISPAVRFVVHGSGEVGVEGEQWLELVELEERARQADKEADLRGDDEPPRAPVGSGVYDRLPSPGAVGTPVPVDLGPQTPEDLGPEHELADEPPEPAAPRTTPRERPTEDPGQGGKKLNLGGR